MCRFIVCIVYIHRYTSFLTEAALTKAGSSRKQTITNANTSCKHLITAEKSAFDLN